MPELPDVELYVHKLGELIVGEPLLAVKLMTPFVLRSVEPALETLVGRKVTGVRRLGKRIVFEFSAGGPFLVVHLMIAGRFQWRQPDAKPFGKISLALFHFANGTLVLTEASKKRRASIHVVANKAGLKVHDPGGIEPLICTGPEFVTVLRTENRTLKRMLTNPKKFSGIGNAFSDEILFVAQLSPVRLTSSLSDAEAIRLYEATVSTLTSWTDRLKAEFKGRFPGAGDVTAFRPEYAVHGKFGQSCPVCGHKVQRIAYAENETNYCAKCQNEGRMLADRSLSRLLKSDWPKTIEEMEG